MEKNLNNPEFPHLCVVRRFMEVDSFTPDDPFSSDNLNDEGFPKRQPREKVIYAGPCRREASNNIRTFRTGSTTVGQVNYGDYRVSLPGRHEIAKGDTVTVTHDLGEDRSATVLHPNYSRLRTKRCPQGRTEFYYNLPDI